MSVKHIKAYYGKIAQDYISMKEELKDMENELNDGMVSPEMVEQMKKTIEPLHQNYMRWSYVMFLLNQPNKKSKEAKYKKQNEELIKKFANTKDEHQENEEAINKIKTKNFTNS